MLTFLRKIRKSVIDSGATRKYLLYAIGEILLVMIGILLALQVNNWNEKRMVRKSELATLIAIRSEFSSNQNIINNCIRNQSNMKLANDSLLYHVGPKAPFLSLEKFQNWIWTIGDAPYCRLSSDVVEDIKNSGKLSTISNEQIRLAITGWTSSLENIRIEETEFRSEFSRQFMPYTNIHISWTDVDRNILKPTPWELTNANFEYQHQSLLKQSKFANILHQHGWRRGRLIVKYNNMVALTNKILTNIDSAIDMF